MVSPLDTNCQSRFTYTGNGKIIPSLEKDPLAQKTIDLLGLNCKHLKDQRKSIITTLETTDSDFLEQSMEKCIDWYNGYYTVIQFVAEKNRCN